MYHFINLGIPKFAWTPPPNHIFNAENIDVGGMDDPNPTCSLCVNCTVTGSPAPFVTWQFQHGSSMTGYDPVVTNQTNASSPYYTQENGQVRIPFTVKAFILSFVLILQKLCFDDIRNYKLVDNTNYRCTASNVGGSVSGTFKANVRKFQLLISYLVLAMF